MNLRSVVLEGKMYNIISKEEYCARWQAYSIEPSLQASTAVEIKTEYGTYILPFRTKTDERPGIHHYGPIYTITFPTDENFEDYLIDDLEIIDFRNTNSMTDFLSKNEQVRDLESTILANSKNDILVIPITSGDSPAIKALKLAINAKQIDLNAYSSRFGDNFLNDKRILKSGSITLNKLVSICQKLDIEVEIMLRDMNEDVPNPMSIEIHEILTK